MSRETWYVMEDGSCGDPREIRPGADGRLTHSDGRKVAYAPHGPRSRGVDVEQAARKASPVSEPKAGTHPAQATGKARDLKAAEDQPRYKTRESKAD